MQNLIPLLTVIFIPLGILLMAFAALWQMYIMFTETYTLDRYKNDQKLFGVVAVLFFTFSLAVYYYCPNARKKGKWFWITGIAGVLMYALAMIWMPPAKTIGLYAYGHEEVSVFQPCGSSKAYWVDGEDSLVKSLENASLARAEKIGEPYQPVLIQVEWKKEPKAQEGFAANYDGIARITKVIQISTAGQCPTE